MTNQFPGATKMVLSSAAQAVMDAYYSTDSLRAAPALAAVLRTVTDQVDWSWEPCSQLFAIADELEDIKYGTYRCDLNGDE